MNDSTDDKKWSIIDDTEPEPTDADELGEAVADRLDTNRIKQLSAMRRSINRSRSYAVIGAVAATVGAVEMGFGAFRRFQTAGVDRWTILDIALLAALTLAAIIIFRIAVRFHREASI